MEETYNTSSTTEAENAKCSNKLRDFFENTTLHGARFLTEKTILRRLAWFLLLCAAFSFCGYQIHGCLSAYVSRPINTVITTKNAEALDFPAVSVCNLNAISKGSYAAAMRKKDRHVTDEMASKEIEDLIFVTSAPLSATERSKLLTDHFHNDPMYEERGDTLTKSLYDYSHSLKGMLSIEWLNPCEWQGEKCGAQNFSTFLHVKMGKCFTFNSGKEGHRKLQTNMVGSSNGLRLRLNVEEENHVSNFQRLMAGFKVLIHSQRDLPLMDEFGFGMKPGTHTYCALKMIKSINLKAPYETNCSSNYTDVNKQFNADYSIHSCRLQCLHNYNIKTCGCQSVYNITAGVLLCSLKDTFECTYPKVYGNTREEVAECVRLYCPHACESTTYETKLSYASPISNAFARSIPVHLIGGSSARSFRTIRNLSVKEKKEYFRENVVTLDVYFEDLTYDVIQQKPAFDDWALIGAIGGYLGLFLGMSVLTVMEFIDFLVTKAFSTCQKERSKVTRIEVR